ncbi:MAG: hypothetical protein RMZ41_001795 [Nostoc sp. DedVER02]|uniref:hypothetical protein n=1 Tax=unclassified Nostoc TaxID=2593658 RepID=UPI002AD5680F|nr:MULTISPECIES: hypothetical protein [unclassified Nostoc]MDZ7987108.1 hypothetical protein [Nostoc sp. DedVER02]MDZ8111022.1 hypothetical protein [Nostoc sp. DedVER01b]
MSDYLTPLLKELQESQPQLSEDLLSDCVSQLTKLEKAALMYQITKDKSAGIILTNIYLQDATSSKFDTWAKELYLEVIETLGYSISEILDNL